MHLNRPVVGMAAGPAGHGYWLVASDGGIFSFGSASFHGSTGAMHLNRPIVGMAATPGRKGYWLVASDGGIFSFGNAGFHGSTGAIHLNSPIVGMAATPSGHGYWLVGVRRRGLLVRRRGLPRIGRRVGSRADRRDRALRERERVLAVRRRPHRAAVRRRRRLRLVAGAGANYKNVTLDL